MNQDLPDPSLAPADALSSPPTSGGCGDGGACACGAREDTAPVLDVRSIPQAVRHAAVLGAVGSVPVDGAIVLLAPHDPLPLLREIEDRDPAAFAVGYDSSGPDTWAVRLTRVR